ncbi:MAG TPA: phosphoadenosine phosphosulfate reductase family protein [Longimicrobiales bacterium]
MSARPLEGAVRQRYLTVLRRPWHRRLREQARDIIRGGLKLSRRPYVAFSCGKDSSVLAHMVMQQDPTVPLRFLSSGETRLLHDIDGVMQWFRERGAIIEEIHIDRVFSDEWRDATWDEQRRAGRHDLRRELRPGYDAVFLGLRMEESPPRSMSLRKHQTAGLPPFVYRYSGGGLRICPLAAWRTDDVGAYLAEHGIPVLEAYHHEGLAARTTARLTHDAVRHYALSYLYRRDPDSARRLLARFPELRSAL